MWLKYILIRTSRGMTLEARRQHTILRARDVHCGMCGKVKKKEGLQRRAIPCTWGVRKLMGKRTVWKSKDAPPVTYFSNFPCLVSPESK